MKPVLLGVTLALFASTSAWAGCSYHSADSEKKKPEQTAMSKPGEKPAMSEADKAKAS
jgi:hypothetical protein